MAALRPPLVLANRALDWVERNLTSFEPFKGEAEPNIPRQQALVELAMLSMYLKRLPDFANPRLRLYLQFISHVYNMPLFKERLVRVTRDFIPQAFLRVILRETGLDTGDHEWEAVQTLIDSGNVCSSERPPYAMLELRHLLDLGQFAHGLPSYSELYRSSFASKRVNFISTSDHDAYSITHVLFFMSDFGFQPITAISASEIRRIADNVQHLLGMYIIRGNWDLVGELMLACHCLRQTTSDFYAFGWQALANAQLESGAVPGPYYDYKQASARDGTNLQEYLFSTCYHTTLVSALVGAVCPYLTPEC